MFLLYKKVFSIRIKNMNQDFITRRILSGIIDQYISAIREDPHRSIRKLVDMAERTSNGPTQKICYQMMQEMGKNQCSPYYEMIHQLVLRTDPETVSRFGLNLGLNAWTLGARDTRALIGESGRRIPWAVLVDRRPAEERIAFESITEQVKKGLRCGMYSWMFFYGDRMDEWEQLSGLFRTFPENAFGLAVRSGGFRGIPLEAAAAHHNLMILLDSDDGDRGENARRLADARMLYSVYREIANDAQAGEVTSGKWFGEITPERPLFAFTLTADNCPEAAAERVRSYMWDTRLRQTYPLMPSDLITDFLIISRLVTHKEVLYRVDPDGGLSEGKGLRFERCGLRIGDLFSASNF